MRPLLSDQIAEASVRFYSLAVSHIVERKVGATGLRGNIDWRNPAATGKVSAPSSQSERAVVPRFVFSAGKTLCRAATPSLVLVVNGRENVQEKERGGPPKNPSNRWLKGSFDRIVLRNSTLFPIFPDDKIA